jgi:hypothetical protein
MLDKYISSSSDINVMVFHTYTITFVIREASNFLNHPCEMPLGNGLLQDETFSRQVTPVVCVRSFVCLFLVF